MNSISPYIKYVAQTSTKKIWQQTNLTNLQKDFLYWLWEADCMAQQDHNRKTDVHTDIHSLIGYAKQSKQIKLQDKYRKQGS